MADQTPTIDQDEQEKFEAWDDFWAEVLREESAGQPETVVIRGVEIRVPRDVPLRVSRRIEAAAADEADSPRVRALLAELFGEDVLDRWTDAGMGVREFQTVLAWAIRNGKGEPTTFQQAYDIVMGKTGESAPGKAPSTGTASGRSGGTGRRSKRTSGASTASGRSTSGT